MPVDYTFVVPVYCNEGTLSELLKEIYEKVVLPNLPLKAEVVFVDDGSLDGSLSLLHDLREKNASWVTVLKLTRNFGQVSAIRAGMLCAKGECTIVISADRQDPIELANQMLDAYFKENFEVAIGVRETREDGWLRALSSRLAYELIRRVGNGSLPKKGFDYVLLGPRARRFVLSRKESHFFLQGQIVDSGFRIKKFPYKRRGRKVTGSGWSFRKRLAYFLDGLFHGGVFPVPFLWFCGFVLGLGSFALSIYITFTEGIEALVSVKGVLPAVLGVGAIQIGLLGLLLEYVSRTLQQVRGRPNFVVDQVWEPSDSFSTQRRRMSGAKTCFPE